MCNVVEFKDTKLIYKRYASLYFAICVDEEYNELIGLEVIHRYVQLLDEFFGNVCELDIIYGMQNVGQFLLLLRLMLFWMNFSLEVKCKKRARIVS